MSVILKINGQQYEVTGKYGPDVTLNEFIRNVAELRGTKAMCHEGGCGVCIVAVKAAIPPTNEIRIFAVNSVSKWYKVYKLKEALKAITNGNYKLIAGNTGQGVNQDTDYPTNVIDIFNVKELKDYFVDVNLVLGAGITLTDMMNLFLKFSIEREDFFYLKQFYDHMDLVAHLPVRNIGTIGGNLYLKYLNREFPSDLFLLFETVGAMITIVRNNGRQATLTLPEFLTSDMKGKIILNVSLPPLSRFCAIKTFKIMPKSQNAHAVVNAGFFFQMDSKSNLVKRARIVYGNISKSFIHATKTEAILVGKDIFSEKALQEALKTIYDEVVPEDMPAEPSAHYRRMLAVTLYYKAILFLCPIDRKNSKNTTGGEIIKRITSKGTQVFETDKNVWPVNQPVPKLEGLVQCSGEATFANDLPKQNNELFGAFVRADAPPGSLIEGFDTSDALKLPGVIKLYTAKDIPGKNTFTLTTFPTMTYGDEEILCTNEVKHFGQAAAIIVADKENTAIKAAELVKIKYTSISNRKPLLSIKNVLESTETEARINQDIVIEPLENGKDIDQVIKGEFSIGSQYHYQMETQTCVAIPSEDGMDVYASTQWLDLTNVAIASCLNVSVNKINVIVRRLGGAYGAKITRATQIACAAAIVCHLQGRPCRFILPLKTNMKSVGKRSPASCKYEVGVNKKGEIQYLKNVIYSDSGISFNENMSFLITKFFKNGYDFKRWYIEGNSVMTDIPSTTSCRAPCSTEGVSMIENIMERIAFSVCKDPTDVRLLNLDTNDTLIPDMIKQLKEYSNFEERTAQVKTYNDQNRWRKRGLKLIQLSYGLEYFGYYNSIVSVYHADGTISITHGGIEMGQGLNTKVAQVCAYILGIPLEKISVKPSSTITSPNSVVTGASIGSECVALATMRACEILLKSLEPIKNMMENASWEEVVQKAYSAGINLQASYCFTNNGEVKPYDIYAVCALEVEVDMLTGNHDVRRVDLLEDTGRSLNPKIDLGQIEGSLVMGLGYWTLEKLIYDESTGELLTDRTWTYKPPGIKDIPADMRIYFQRNSKNPFGVLQSKATGEPALCLATVIIHAIRDTVRSARLDAGYTDEWFNMENPCSVENIFQAVGHKLEHFTLQ